MQSKLLPVFIVAAIVQMAVLAGAVFVGQKLTETNHQIERSQEILYRAASMERSVLSANMSGSNFLSSLGDSDSDDKSKSAPVAEDVYQKGVQELARLEKLCQSDSYYSEPLAKLKKILDAMRLLSEKMATQMAESKSEGMTGALKVIPAVKALYAVVDKMNTRINGMVEHEEAQTAGLLAVRDQYEQMQTVLLFSALVLALGGAALIPALMKR